MKHFRNRVTGDVYGFEDDGSQDSCITSEMEEMTDQQVYDHVNSQRKLSRDDIARMRQIGYSDPVTGSDRHYMEAVRERAMGNFEAATLAEKQGSTRYEEIKKSLPWPEDLM